jgi:predicted anti-sigma-YlaC factor YlaD
MMTCERTEGLLSAYLEGELAAAERAEVETHLAACAGCSALLGLLEETMAATAAFPQAEPPADLMARLYGIPETEAVKSVRKPFFRPVFDWLARPALQPVYAAFTALFIVLSFVLFHPEGRGIRKQIDLKLHQGIGTVEKLYADAGSLKGEIRAVSANVVKSFNTLGLLGGDENKQ